MIDKIVSSLLQAKRPMIYTGGGVIFSEASQELAELVRALGYPCTNTLMGLRGYPGTDPLFLGMLGMHGTYEANMAMQECDVLFAVGARFDDRVIGNPKHFYSRKIIHLDIDPSSISKRVTVDLPVVGDVKATLRKIIEKLGKMNTLLKENGTIDDWWMQIEKWRGRKCLSMIKRAIL